MTWRSDDGRKTPPILRGKHHHSPSVFTPDALLREARRQKSIDVGAVPDICILDPDGDIVRHLLMARRAHRLTVWPCYHTELYTFRHEGLTYGIVSCAVGAAFAVLVAEELFTCGCQLLLSMASAGQVLPVLTPPYFIVIDRALRDEGTSYHYLPAADYSFADGGLVELARGSLAGLSITVHVGATWTTDAPFRETADAITAAREAGILAVEMEAAALYAFATARQKAVICLAHVTNQMGRVEGDFEKGADDGAGASLKVVAGIARGWRQRPQS